MKSKKYTQPLEFIRNCKEWLLDSRKMTRSDYRNDKSASENDPFRITPKNCMANLVLLLGRTRNS